MVRHRAASVRHRAAMVRQRAASVRQRAASVRKRAASERHRAAMAPVRLARKLNKTHSIPAKTHSIPARLKATCLKALVPNSGPNRAKKPAMAAKVDTAHLLKAAMAPQLAATDMFNDKSEFYEPIEKQYHKLNLS